MLQCQFLKFPNRLGFVHDGLLFPGHANGVGVIHVHGSLQNFYSTGFIPALAQAYQAAGVTFLTFNLTCHDAISEGEFIDGHVEYVGGAISDFQSCLDDIDAAITFLRERCAIIVLQGHSLGCDRVVNYLLKVQNSSLMAMLLSPCDSFRLQYDYLGGVSPEEQAKRLERDCCLGKFELLPESEYGVRQGGAWSYPIPVSRSALLSLIHGPPFKLFNLSHPIKFNLNNPTLAILGENDALTGTGPDQMVTHLSQRFTSFDAIVDKQSDHSFAGREAWLGSRLVEWIEAHSSIV